MLDVGAPAEDESVFVHDFELPAQQSDRTGGLEVEHAIRIPLQHVPEPAGAGGQLTVFDAHPLPVIGSVGARGLRLVGGGEHFDGLAQVSVVDPVGRMLPFVVDVFRIVLAECKFESEQAFGDGFGARVGRRQWRVECFLAHLSCFLSVGGSFRQGVSHFPAHVGERVFDCYVGYALSDKRVVVEVA